MESHAYYTDRAGGFPDKKRFDSMPTCGQVSSFEETASVEEEEEAGQGLICQTIVIVFFKNWIVVFCSAMRFPKRSC